MSDTTFIGSIPVPKAETVALPKPEPFDAPVLIGDCVTPLAGETVLSLLMRKLAATDQTE